MEYQDYQTKQPIKQPKERMNKKMLLGFLVLLFLVFAVSWILYNYMQKPVVINPLPTNYVTDNRKMIPEGFPIELYFEKDKSLWQRSEDTLTGFGERVRIIEAIYEDHDKTFISNFKKHIESLGWKQTLSDDSNKITYAVYEMNGNRFILATTNVDNGLFVNMTYTTYVSN